MNGLDDLDRAILNAAQEDLPLTHRPFAALAGRLNIDEAEVLARLRRMKEAGIITRFGPFFDAAAMGGAFCLCAMAVPEDEFETVMTKVNARPEVAHNYERADRSGRRGDRAGNRADGPSFPETARVLHRISGRRMTLDRTDRDIVAALQEGLPLVAEPYAQVAADLGMDEAVLIRRLDAMNHYRLGMTANGMTVWDVEDSQVTELGALVGALPFVTHCYERPRALPDWPYNLFAMVHGATRDEVEEKRARIAALLGGACRAHDILYSTRILKKTGLRLRRKG